MSPAHQIMCSFVLTYGVPMVLAWRELHQLGRLPRHRPDPGPAPEPLPLPWPVDGNRSLPACLQPRPAELVGVGANARPARELELV